MLNLKKIWSPDTIIMNSADGDGYMKINADFSYVPVYNDGTVYFSTNLIGLKTRYLKILFFENITLFNQIIFSKVAVCTCQVIRYLSFI